jgi:hypothetical protein
MNDSSYKQGTMKNSRREDLVAIPDVPGCGVTINPKWLSAVKRLVVDVKIALLVIKMGDR